MILVCRHCKNEFSVRPYRKDTAKYCSLVCCRAAKRDAMKKSICINCGSQVIRPHHPQRSYQFCSHRCANRFNQPLQAQSVVSCKNCGKEVVVWRYQLNPHNSNRSAKQFCSNQCAGRFRDAGRTSLAFRLRTSKRYAEWRLAVFERDNFTCQECGQRGGKLNADHIMRFADYPSLRFDVSNGRTLCVACHLLTETFGNRGIAADSKWDMVAINEEA